MTIRSAGGRWRLLAHNRAPDPESAVSYHVSSYPHLPAAGHYLPDTEFDELVVGRWLHVEQMDIGRWWMNIGGVTIWVTADRDGRPRAVSVYGPHDYAEPADGCTYECTWTPPQ